MSGCGVYRSENAGMSSANAVRICMEAGAEVRNCVLFKETAVRRGAAVSHLIADKNVEILPDRTLMGHSSYPIVLAKGSQV